MSSKQLILAEVGEGFPTMKILATLVTSGVVIGRGGSVGVVTSSVGLEWVGVVGDSKGIVMLLRYVWSF